ncbi:MAG: GNAT family N-acetyltransferase, partial [Anaerolineae bacterium]|nr:GNAT family N-acetyltransferase [Anaerolineae bacterium]
TIERLAAGTFERLGLVDLYTRICTSSQEFAEYQQAGCLWVAVEDDQPVGFIAVSWIETQVHIDEVDVLPAYARRGIGRALVERVCHWAAEQSADAVTLSTHTNVPWNAPFYAKLGFVVMSPDNWTPAYQEMRQQEIDLGFPVQDRAFMIRRL